MKGDFSRVSFNPDHGFTRVNWQQGRMQLDSDANEQQAINLHMIRALAADLIGPYGATPGSFVIGADASMFRDFTIAGGTCYVDGWRCLNRATVAYRGLKETPGQPWFPDPPELEEGQSYAVYLEAWERHVSSGEFDRARDPAEPDAVREVALGGPDTGSRAQLVWQVHALPVDAIVEGEDPWPALLDQIRPAARGTMKAKAAEPPAAGGPPCEVSPRARFRGDSDQLYRVEIRRGGIASAGEGGATFVWSRENGAVTFAVDRIAGQRVTLAAGWRDARFALAPGDIVEVAGPAQMLQDSTAPLLRVMDYDPDSATVTLDGTPEVDTDDRRAPIILRRWDHGELRGPSADRPKLADDNALQLIEGRWLTLEDGIQVLFGEESGRMQPLPNGGEADRDAVAANANVGAGRAGREKPRAGEAGARATYRQGDYWLIPSRVTLADILWPRAGDGGRAPLSLPPHGVDRHYAPLAMIQVAGDGSVSVARDLRREFRPLTG